MKFFVLNIFFPKKLKSVPDEELIELYKKSENLDYLGELFQRKLPMIASLSLKYLKNKEESEDASYELFEVLKRDLLKHEVSNINAWIFSVTRNHCYKKLNKQSKNPTQSLDAENSVKSFMESESDSDLFEKVRKEEQLVLLENTILNLKDDQKLCIELFYLKQYSYVQIEEETGIELNKVKSHIQNGKRNLKIMMEDNLSKIEKGQ